MLDFENRAAARLFASCQLIHTWHTTCVFVVEYWKPWKHGELKQFHHLKSKICTCYFRATMKFRLTGSAYEYVVCKILVILIRLMVLIPFFDIYIYIYIHPFRNISYRLYTHMYKYIYMKSEALTFGGIMSMHLKMNKAITEFDFRG